MNKLKELVEMIGSPVDYEDILNICEREDVVKFAKDNNLVIVNAPNTFCVYFIGAIFENIEINGKGKIYIGKNAIVDNILKNTKPECLDCANECINCVQCLFHSYYWKNHAHTILDAFVSDIGWKFYINIPHEKIIVKSDYSYNECIVFCLDDIGKSNG